MNDIKTNLNNTIDLRSDYLESKDRELVRRGYIKDITFYEKIMIKFTKTIFFLALIGILSLFNIIFWEKTYANYEFKTYNVTNYKDLARMKRVETCKRVNPNTTREQVIHCATMNTLVTAMESASMQSNRCIRDNNCKWLKGWQNGKYGFMKFDSLYEQNIYFAEKFWKYHYKKSFFTFVYGYKQSDGSYRYGWSYTDQASYLQFLKSKYSTVYNEIDNVYEK